MDDQFDELEQELSFEKELSTSISQKLARASNKIYASYDGLKETYFNPLGLNDHERDEIYAM